MSAHTRIRPARGLPARLWRALRICRWMTTGSLVSISGGDVPAAQVRRTRSAAPALSAGGRQANWRLVRDLGPQAPTHRRRTGHLHDHNTGQELPCGNNSRKPLDKENKNAVTRHSIDHLRS